MINPSNKVTSMQLNGENLADVSSTSLLTSGLTARSDNKLQSWTIHTRTISEITSIGLINSPNVVGPIEYQLFDGFDTIYEATGNSVGQIISLKGEFIEKIVISAKSITRDGRPPSNLKLVINGCFTEDLLRTKAQIESRTTVTAGNDCTLIFICSLFVCLFVSGVTKNATRREKNLFFSFVFKKNLMFLFRFM